MTPRNSKSLSGHHLPGLKGEKKEREEEKKKKRAHPY
jgi:hypothetical protein